MTNQFSVLIAVYANEKANFLTQSLQSILEQSLPANEVIVVKDGPLGIELEDVLVDFQLKFGTRLKTVSLPKNVGLGLALQAGLERTNFDIVARMDSDDIAEPNRFEQQIAFLAQNPECDLVGSTIFEFDYTPSRPLRIRSVRESHDEIYKAARWQNPLNHMTVVFRKNKVLQVGGYKHVPFFEDYDLWIRLLLAGGKFHNISNPLVRARVGDDMIGKRHGLNYCRHEISFFKRACEAGFISRSRMITLLCTRLPLRLLPKRFLALIYQRILRKNSL